MERTERHWQNRRQQAMAEAAAAATLPAPTIAINREAGGLATSVAQEVGARLGWPVYDHELLERIAKEKGLRVDLLETLDERRQSWMLEAMRSFSAAPFVSENSFVHHVIQAILSLGAHGQCIIVGRGAAHILPAKTTLRVRLVGLLKDRIAALGRTLGLSAAEAATRVEEIDRERTAFMRTHFGCDPTDPHQYDLVLNISRWSVSQCADLIIQAVHHLES
jgi:cytidylate kinase